jgi:hypothetical protein
MLEASIENLEHVVAQPHRSRRVDGLRGLVDHLRRSRDREARRVARVGAAERALPLAAAAEEVEEAHGGETT